jgi:HD-like signal output (HDOD) protein/tRNA A-37 threonylcarbamoyl transferase component Bud32
MTDVPQLLGVYRVLGLLGEGGMGRVYLAEHTVIGRRVAIKVLAAEVARDAEMVSRFFTEARAVNEIRHPNIVEVTDLGTHDGRPYIVMEYLEGETLASRIAREGALSPDVVARIARQIASALGAVHERGIVHRDLKPANVLLREHPDYPDFVKILDFGIAKLIGRENERNHRTQVGAVLGTPAYMSPEQCLGEQSLDVRSDVYSFGVVLFEMATGRQPFVAESMGRLIMAHMQDPPPPPASINSQVSRGMSVIILRMLAKKPADRFPGMREVRAALDALASGAGSTFAADATMAAPPGLTPSPAPAAPAPRAPPAAAHTFAERTAQARPSARAAVAPPPVLPAVATPAADADERLVARVAARLEAGGSELPALPAVVAAALDIVKSPGFSFPAAVDLLRRDTRLVSLLVRMANVEPYGSRAPAINLEQAISRLGAQGLGLGLVEHVSRPVIEARSSRADALFRRPWPHALAGAFVARRLVQMALPNEEPAHGYLAGLLRDIGQPLVAALVDDVERRAPDLQARRSASEGAVLRCVQAHHRDVTAAVVREWRLPAPVLAALLPDAAGSGARLPAAVRLASLLADLEGFYLRREDLARAESEIVAARGALGVDEILTRRATQRLKEWVATRG